MRGQIHPTGPYPPGQVNPWEELELVGGPADRQYPLTEPKSLAETEDELRRVGLGFLPAVAGVYEGADQLGLTDAVGSFFGNLFGGDTPDHDPEKVAAWASGAAMGQGICASGRRENGSTVRFDPREVREAIRWAPRGRPHQNDAPGTVEGLRSAVLLEGSAGEGQAEPLIPYVQTDDTLANVAVGVAHGRLDCVVGWQEEPAVEHLTALVNNYRARPASSPPPADSAAAQRPSSSSPAIASIFPTSNVSPLVLLLLGGGAIAAAMYRPKGRR